MELLLHYFLPPVLLKLTSQQEGVRKKVMELLVHINKRIKNNNNIQLPVDALLLQYQDPVATSFVVNFTIIYIKMGFPRLSTVRRGLALNAGQHRRDQFHLFHSRQPRESHLDVDDGKVDNKGCSHWILILKE